MNCMTSKTFEYDIKQRTEGFQEIPIQQDEVLLRVAIFHPITHNKTQVRQFQLKLFLQISNQFD